MGIKTYKNKYVGKYFSIPENDVLSGNLVDSVYFSKHFIKLQKKDISDIRNSKHYKNFMIKHSKSSLEDLEVVMKSRISILQSNKKLVFDDNNKQNVLFLLKVKKHLYKPIKFLDINGYNQVGAFLFNAFKKQPVIQEIQKPVLTKVKSGIKTNIKPIRNVYDKKFSFVQCFQLKNNIISEVSNLLQNSFEEKDTKITAEMLLVSLLFEIPNMNVFNTGIIVDKNQNEPVQLANSIDKEFKNSNVLCCTELSQSQRFIHNSEIYYNKDLIQANLEELKLKVLNNINFYSKISQENIFILSKKIQKYSGGNVTGWTPENMDWEAADMESDSDIPVNDIYLDNTDIDSRRSILFLSIMNSANNSKNIVLKINTNKSYDEQYEAEGKVYEEFKKHGGEFYKNNIVPFYGSGEVRLITDENDNNTYVKCIFIDDDYEKTDIILSLEQILPEQSETMLEKSEKMLGRRYCITHTNNLYTTAINLREQLGQEDNKDEIQANVLLECLNTVLEARLKYDFYHGDFKNDNVMIEYTNANEYTVRLFDFDWSGFITVLNTDKRSIANSEYAAKFLENDIIKSWDNWYVTNLYKWLETNEANGGLRKLVKQSKDTEELFKIIQNTRLQLFYMDIIRYIVSAKVWKIETKTFRIPESRFYILTNIFKAVQGLFPSQLKEYIAFSRIVWNGNTDCIFPEGKYSIQSHIFIGQVRRRLDELLRPGELKAFEKQILLYPKLDRSNLTPGGGGGGNKKKQIKFVMKPLT